MAVTRPITIILQELATLNTAVPTASLNTLIAGPCYHLMDYLDDQDDIKIADSYGALDVENPFVALATPTNDVVVAEPPNNKPGATLVGSSVKVYGKNIRVQIVEDTDAGMTTGTTSLTSTTVLTTGDVAALIDLDTGTYYAIITDSASTVTMSSIVTAVTNDSFTVADELPGTFTDDASSTWRIEKVIAETLIPSAFVSLNGNEITILGGITLPAALNGGSIPVNYIEELFIEYKSLRQDLQDVISIETTADILANLGKVDARNPLAVGLTVARSNTASKVFAYGVASDDTTGYGLMSDAISNRDDIFAVVPLNASLSIITALKNAFVGLADPVQAAVTGTPQKFRVAIGCPDVALPPYRILVDDSTGGTQVNGASPATSTVTVASGIDFVAIGTLPGDKVTISAGPSIPGFSGDWIVQHVVSATAVELRNSSGAVPITGGTKTLSVYEGESGPLRDDTGGDVVLTVGADDSLYLDLFDPEASFITAGVIAGDLIQMPAQPAGTDYTVSSFNTVATVVSNQRLRIVNAGGNTHLVEKELPHLFTRTAPVTAIAATNTLHYKVVRTATKDLQVTQLNTMPASVDSKRGILTYPFRCEVADLIDGGLTRTSPTVPTVAGIQPGFYLSCAVAGMSAGLPPHQGFTNIGVAGVTKIYDSNTYFSNPQLTLLSNAGWYVFVQDSFSANPYTIHQVTTDTSTLVFSEFSMVRTFDHVSMVLYLIQNGFIGSWNLNAETIGFIKAALEGGINSFTSVKLPKIGAELISGNITKMAQIPGAKDQLETFIECSFPAPLNKALIHLVSV